MPSVRLLHLLQSRPDPSARHPVPDPDDKLARKHRLVGANHAEPSRQALKCSPQAPAGQARSAPGPEGGLHAPDEPTRKAYELVTAHAQERVDHYLRIVHGNAARPPTPPKPK